MPQWVHCPQCDQHYQFPDAAVGKQASCPKCGKVLTVSAPAPARMPIPPAPRLPIPVPQQEDEPLWALPVSSEGGRPSASAEQGRAGRPGRPVPSEAPPPRPAAAEPVDESLPATAGDDPTAYYHAACRGTTTFSQDVAARISGDPFGFIPATFCAKCRRYVGLRAVTWQGTRETLAAYRTRLRRQMHPFRILMRLVGGPLIVTLLLAGVGALANPNARLLGALAGVVIGVPLGYFVTGVLFQIGWAMARRRKGSAAAGGPKPGGG